MPKGVCIGVAEYIDRKKLMDDISKYSIENYAGLIRNVVMKQPVVDVAEVVRCKNCVYATTSHHRGLLCTAPHGMTGTFVSDMDYCSVGRRNGDG